MYIHLFAIRQRIFKPLEVDSMYVIANTDPLVMMDQDTFIAAEELSHIPDDVKKKRNMVTTYIKTFEWRSRFNTDMYPKLLRLDIEVEMGFEELESYINSLPKDRLEAKLKAMEFW